MATEDNGFKEMLKTVQKDLEKGRLKIYFISTAPTRNFIDNFC